MEARPLSLSPTLSQASVARRASRHAGRPAPLELRGAGGGQGGGIGQGGAGGDGAGATAGLRRSDERDQSAVTSPSSRPFIKVTGLDYYPTAVVEDINDVEDISSCWDVIGM